MSLSSITLSLLDCIIDIWTIYQWSYTENNSYMSLVINDANNFNGTQAHELFISKWFYEAEVFEKNAMIKYSRG